MGRRTSRGSDGYYDPGLVELVDGLFKSAALLQDNRIKLFVSEGNHKPEPGRVRELFGIEKIEISDWRLGNWEKRSPAWPVGFVDRLITAFADNYMDLVDEADAPTARMVHEYWLRTCEADLAEVRLQLGPHRARVEKDVATHVREKRSSSPPLSDERPMDPGPRGQAIVQQSQDAAPQAPLNLTPPEFPNSITRSSELAQLSKRAQEHLGVVIEGWARSGKRHIAHQFLTTLPTNTRILWIDLTAQSDFRDVLAMLAQTSPPFVPSADLAVAALPDWLKATDTMLVLAGLEAANVATFAQLLQSLSRRSGPCRVIITSAVKTGGTNICEVGRLNAAEAIALLDLMDATYDADEIRSMAREGELSPFLLRQAAARFGSVNRSHLAVDIDEQHADIVAGLPERLRSAYEILQVLNMELDVAVVAEVLTALGVAEPPRQVLADFERLLLVRRVTAQSWRLAGVGSVPLARYIGVEELKRVLVRIAVFFRGKTERGGGLPAMLSHQDCLNLFAACRLLQMADHDSRQRHRLRNRIAGPMERYGAHRQLLPLYEYEVAASDDDWDVFRYARILFVIGHYDRALRVIDRLFHDLVAEGEDLNAELYLSVMRLLSELLIELDRADLAARILDAAIERIDVASLSYVVCTSTVSVLSSALAKSGLPADCLTLNERILGQNFAGLELPFSFQISAIRRGVALRELGRLPESIEALAGACAFFAREDARAFAWSSGHLALSLQDSGDHAAAEAALRTAANVAALHGLANGEARAIYRHFEDASIYPDLQPLIRQEIERLAPFEREWTELRSGISGTRLIEHVLLDLEIDLAKPLDFQLTKYELMSFASPHAISSRFNRTLVRRLRDTDLESVLGEIFETKPPEAIFRNHLYNRIIVDACRESNILIKKFVLPFVPVIQNQPDSILFLYARLLEWVDEWARAEALLNHARDKSCFSYYNISANCAARYHPQKALDLNDQALSVSQRRQQRAQILHNKAQVVYDHDIRYRYDEAIQWCEASIREASKPDFFWPRNLLLKIKLAQCPLAHVEETIRVHWARFRMPLSRLAAIVDQLQRGRLRNAALRAIDNIAQTREAKSTSS